jgi:protein O-mannosyl-transferase
MSKRAVAVIFGALIIAVLVSLIYWSALDGDFILDDDVLLTTNRLLTAPNGLYRLWYTTEATDYWPMTNTSFWIEWRLWGMHSKGYHVTNVVLHVAAALLLWVVLNQLAIPGGFLAALFWAVHPVNVESVAWIAQRKNTLAAVFFLLSTLWYLKAEAGGDEKGISQRREKQSERGFLIPAHWYGLSLIALVLAMLSKGSTVVAPLVFVALIWWQRGKLSRRDLVHLVPFFLVAAALTVLNVWFRTHGSQEAIRQAGWPERLAGAGAAVWFYLSKAFAPIDLVFVYPKWHIETMHLAWWLPLAMAAIVSAVLWRYRHHQWLKALCLAWACFCLALLPALGLIDVYFMKFSLVADHYQHIALMAVVTLLAASLVAWYRVANPAAQRAIILSAAVIASALTVLSVRQAQFYASPFLLYNETLEKNPDCWLVHNNLGTKLLDAGHAQEAIEHFEEVLKRNPNYAAAHNNLGMALIRTGQANEAIQEYKRALGLRADFPEAYFNLANALRVEGQIQGAIELYQRALNYDPDSAATRVNLAGAFLLLGDWEKAIEQSQEAIRLRPDYIEAYRNAAIASAQMGRSDWAASYARKALQLARAQGSAELALQIEKELATYESAPQDRLHQ